MRHHLSAWQEHEQIERGRSPLSVQTYMDNVLQFIAWLERTGRPTSPSDIQRMDITDFMKALFYEYRCLKNSTRAQKLASIRSYFSFLRYRGITVNDPTSQVPSPKIEKLMPSKFSTDDLRKIFSAPDDSPRGRRDRAILKTIYAAGLRVSEFCSLNIEDIADTGGFVALKIMGKGSKQRIITIRANPAKDLRAWLSLRLSIEARTTALFLSKNKERLTPKSISNILKKYAAASGVPSAEAFVHKLRATWATDLYDSGRDRCAHCGQPVQKVDMLEICALAGWDEPKTAMRYIAISNKVLRKTAIPDRRFKEIEG